VIRYVFLAVSKFENGKMRKVFVKGLAHKRSAYFPRQRNTSASKGGELEYVPLTTPEGDETLMVKAVGDQPRGHNIYTTPSPIKDSVYDFVESERSRSRSPIKSPPTYAIGSPVAGPSWRSPVRLTGIPDGMAKSPIVMSPTPSRPVSESSPLRIDNEWVDTDESDEGFRPRRRTVAEKQQVADDTPVSLLHT